MKTTDKEISEQTQNTECQDSTVYDNDIQENHTSILSDMLDKVSIYGICFITGAVIALGCSVFMFRVNTYLGCIVLGAVITVFGTALAFTSRLLKLVCDSQSAVGTTDAPKNMTLGKVGIIILTISLAIGLSLTAFGIVMHIKDAKENASSPYVEATYIYNSANTENTFEVDANEYSKVKFSPEAAGYYVIGLDNAILQGVTDNKNREIVYNNITEMDGDYDNYYRVFLTAGSEYTFRIFSNDFTVSVEIEKDVSSK